MQIFSQAKVSPVGKVNKADLKKIARDTVIFFAAPALIYLGQLTGTLAVSHVLLLPDFVPSLMTIGALEGWAVGIAVNFFLKFQNGKV